MLAWRELTFSSVLLRLLLAVLVGGVLGFERGRKDRPAGLRTYILVTVGSTIVMMTNQYAVQCFGAGDPVRMGAQVVSGIGFLGAGSIIITGRNQIRGITTAAGMWAAAGMGLAIGIGFVELGVIGGLTCFIVLTGMDRLEHFTRQKSNVMELYVELEDKQDLVTFIRHLRESDLEMSEMSMEQNSMTLGKGVALVLTVQGKNHLPHWEMMERLREAPHVVYIEEL